METAYPHLADLRLVYELVRDWCSRFFPVVQYKRLLVTDDELDTVHNEIPERAKRWSDPIGLRAYADPVDQQYLLSRYGTAEARPVGLQVSVPDLIDAGLAWQDDSTKEVVLIAKSGDRFVYSEEIEHDILTVRRGRMFGNTDVPVFYVFDTMRKREEATTYEGV